MATGSTQFPIHNKVISQNIVDYVRKAQQYLYSQFSIRDTLEYVDREYQRENDMTEENWKAKLAVRAGDKRKRTNVTVPVVMPQVESALAYMYEIYLSGYPIFGVGSPPEFDDAALQMETIIAENSIVAGWARHFNMFFRDGFKYNLQAIEVEWDQTVTAAVEANEKLDNGQGKPKEVIWKGNCLRRMDLYNTFFDPRCTPADIHREGEFAGYTRLLSRVQLKRMMNARFNKIPQSVALRAMESFSQENPAVTGSQDLGYYIPTVNPYAMISPSELGSFDWLAWATDTARTKIQYKNIYAMTKMYARIIPSDFDLYVPQDNTPQIWKFLVINNQVLIEAERLTNAHDYLPMIFGQPMEDGLDYQTKSLAMHAIPFQDLASAAMNANIASKRRLVMDRTLFDPSRIREADINNDNPSAKIPVRPAAYGKPVHEAVHQFPYRDELGANVVQEAELYVRYANLTTGSNPAQQGQFMKGNKTRHEFQDTMGHSNARNKMMAGGTEMQVMVPIKEIVRLNILQYQEGTSLYNRDREVEVKIDPVKLRQAVAQFKISDGMLSSDKLLNTEEFQVAVQVLGSSPQIASGYRMSDVFSHLFKQRGVDLRPFEKTPAELQYEQQLQAWQAAAANAAKEKAPFNVPMPQPPDPALVQEQIAQMRKRRGMSLQEMMKAIEKTTAQPGV